MIIYKEALDKLSSFDDEYDNPYGLAKKHLSLSDVEGTFINGVQLEAIDENKAILNVFFTNKEMEIIEVEFDTVTGEFI